MTPPRRRLAPWLLAHRSALLLLFFGVLLPLLAFGLIAEDVIEHQAFAVDHWLPLWLHGHAGPGFDRLMLFVSFVGSVTVMAPLDLLVAVILLWRRQRRAAVFWALAVGGAALINSIVKHLVQRVRPELWVSIAPETSFSFPSGHAMASMAFAVALVVLASRTPARRGALLGGILFVALVGVSRVYLGVHFPTDIAAGWAASFAWVVGLQLVLRTRR
jgi:undecaprenyl-diphosphatase